MTPDANALPPGTRIDDYEIREWLGGGGFGITYLARDLQLDLPVAIKEYFPADCACRGTDGQVRARSTEPTQREAFDTGLDRFIAEARALASFRHPNIVRVLRHLRARGTAFIVMEYERGEPLPRWLAAHQPLDEATLLALLMPLLDGLQAVHAAGFLHRDIKPDNIHVREDGSPVLLDFGAARRVLAGQGATSIVSPGFAPFEQYHSQGDQGPWSDLYALGSVLYWMVTGRKPMEAAARIQADLQPAAADEAEPGRFSDALLSAIDWAIRPSVAERPQTVAAFREALTGSDHPSPRRSPVTAQARTSATAIPGLPRLTTARLEALTRRNLLASIACIDLIALPKQPSAEQARARRTLHEVLARVLEALPSEQYLAADAPAGALLCFLGDPDEALDAVLLLRDLLSRRTGGAMLRVGLHLGPVRVVVDLHRGWRLIGDGQEVAHRITGFAQAQEVLVSGPFHDAVAPIGEARARQFRYLGPRQDAHGRLHELYAVRREVGGGLGSSGQGGVAHTAAAADALHAAEAPPSGVAPGPPSGGRTVLLRTSSTSLPPSVPSAPSPLPAHLLAELESILSLYLGPVARVLVRQQARLGLTAGALVDALAGQIDGPAQSAAFRMAARKLLGR